MFTDRVLSNDVGIVQWSQPLKDETQPLEHAARVYGTNLAVGQPQTPKEHTLVPKGRVWSVVSSSLVVVSLKNGTVQTAFFALPSADVVRHNASFRA